MYDSSKCVVAEDERRVPIYTHVSLLPLLKNLL